MTRALLLSVCIAVCACVETDDGEVAPYRNPYIGTEWIMEGGGPDAPTVEFTDSRASGSTGCNRWFAQVFASDVALSFSAIGSTRRMCEAELMETERQFIAALRDTRSARMDADVLILRDVAGAELARFDRIE